MASLDGKSNIVEWNASAERLLGWKYEEVAGGPLPMVSEEESEDVKTSLNFAFQGQALQWSGRYRKKDGSPIELSISALPLRGPDGRIEAVFAVFSESAPSSVGEAPTPEHCRLAPAEQLEHDYFRELVENNLDSISVFESDGKYVYQSPAAAAALGYSPEEFIGKLGLSFIHPEDRSSIEEAVKKEKANPGMTISVIYRQRTKDGQWRTFDARGKYIPSGPEKGRFIVNSRDVTERMGIEEQLNRMLYAINQSENLIGVLDMNGMVEYVNDKILALSGLAPEEVNGKTLEELKVLPAETMKEIQERLSSGKEWRGILQHVNQRKEPFTTSAVFSPIRDRSGRITHILTVEEDITERQELEAKFQQSQRMESVGRLAGGIAHDFNNLLTAILGNCFFLLGETSASDPRHKDVEEIQRTAQRAADLTRQLLAFSRRQIFNPKTLRLDQLVLNMDRMLRRLIGEDIELVILTPSTLKSVHVDPGQIEQVIVNLVVNARDAMPNGGKLIIEILDAHLDISYALKHLGAKIGDFVQINISDTGMGMAPEVQEHLFEPFFTTKEQGKGTGLGLATCYGIVTQSKGHISVYSEVGRGTVFKIFLPANASETEKKEIVVDPTDRMPKGKETILIAEDESFVRRMATRVLSELGYEVISASTGEEALRIVGKLDADKRIDMLFTDIVMPQLGGKELAETLTKRWPGFRVLFTSGYTDATIVHQGVLDAGKAFLGKPYSPQLLAQKIRDILDNPPGRN